MREIEIEIELPTNPFEGIKRFFRIMNDQCPECGTKDITVWSSKKSYCNVCKTRIT